MKKLKLFIPALLLSTVAAYGAIEWGNLIVKGNLEVTGTATQTGVATFTAAPIFSALTATTVPYLNASKALTSSAVTPTELGYLSGVTSAIQTQINAITSNVTNLKNYAQNGEFRFWQRRSTPTTLTNTQDDAYAMDRWYTLTSGGAVNVGTAQVAEEVSGSVSRYVAQVRQEDTTSRQFGIAQILETSRVVELKGKQVTLAFYARTDTTEITALRACIGEWDSTADTVTSDVVSSWSATPSWIANFECINTPADLTISSSWTQLSITATLETDFNNLVIVIWTPNAEAENDDFYLTQVQLVQNASALAWDKIALSPSRDYEEVARFYQLANNGCTGGSYSTTNVLMACNFHTQMRASPTPGQTATITVHDPSTATYTQSGTSIVASYPTTRGLSILLGNFSGMTAFRPMFINNAETSSITLDAEL